METRADARIRAATAADGPRLAEIYRPYVDGSAVSFEEPAPDGAEMGRRVAGRGAFPWLVLEEGGRVLGYAYGGPFRARFAWRYTCEVSVYLDEGARGRGLGRVLYEALFEELRAMGQCSAVAVIADPETNVASVGLHRALGFEEIGVLPRAGWKLGAWHAVGIYGLSLRDGAPSCSHSL